ncbi:hypothetical protein BRC95_01580 [Halobacteriales archaeon QS_5_68_33]|jgi:hypothetical protein|nr:MAG: hypothetical protein BRC95_01580 [Halobacteriales archaeon QS_5_68_33]
MTKETETCGRCSMTSVVDAVEADDEGEATDRDPLGEDRIEVPETEMRKAAAPAVLAGRVKRKLDAFATRFTYGR